MALACGMTGGMREFRRCVSKRVMSKTAWTEAPPSRAATEWKGHLIEISMARGREYAARKEFLRLCFPGYWRHSERSDFCRGAHFKRLKAERLLKLAIANRVIQSMYSHSHSIKKYP